MQPIPVPFWPQWANYCTLDYCGLIRFWSNKPKHLGNRWGVIGGKRADWGYVDGVGDCRGCIWSRN